MLLHVRLFETGPVCEVLGGVPPPHRMLEGQGSAGLTVGPMPSSSSMKGLVEEAVYTGAGAMMAGGALPLVQAG